jgi:hypothetical protein
MQNTRWVSWKFLPKQSVEVQRGHVKACYPAMGVQQVEGGVDKEMPSPNETVALVGTTTARRVMLMMYCILIAFRRVKRGICSSLLGAYP